MLDDNKAVHPTGKNRNGRGTVAENPITVHPGGLVETYLGPPGDSTPLEALMHQAETVADTFNRLGRETSDVELAYEIIYALVRARKREAQMEAALRKIYELAQHAPVATKAEQVIADIQRECKRAGVGADKSCKLDHR
jgi:hypothetical protein